MKRRYRCGMRNMPVAPWRRGAVSGRTKSSVFAAGILVLLSACASVPGSIPVSSAPSSGASASPVPQVNSSKSLTVPAGLSQRRGSFCD